MGAIGICLDDLCVNAVHRSVLLAMVATPRHSRQCLTLEFAAAAERSDTCLTHPAAFDAFANAVGV